MTGHTADVIETAVDGPVCLHVRRKIEWRQVVSATERASRITLTIAGADTRATAATDIT